jgi:hypothetical protein
MESAFRNIWTYSLLTFVVVALCVGAFAQGGQGELTGQVTDTTGAVVSGVEVKLSNAATGEVRTTVTTPAGTYRFPALPIVGTYALEITSKGFKSVKVQNVVVTVGQITTRDIKLEVGAATEQVTVEAGTQLVQTEDASLSPECGSAGFGRTCRWRPATRTTSSDCCRGAEPALNSGAGTVMGGTDRGASVNGARSGTGNFMVEGFDNNDQGQGGAGSLGSGAGGSNTTISPDAIEEYRVIEGTPSAEYGKAGGFVTDTVLKGGTNQWHGSLFEYNRIQALAANSFFSNLSGTQDHLIRNQFGGSVGGPIIKDKTFFYFTAEAHRLRIGSPLSVNTFTDEFLNFVKGGGFETFMETDPGGICELNLGHTCPGAFSGNASTGAVFNKILAAQSNLPICVVASANCTNQSATAGGLWTSPNIIGAPQITYPYPVYGTTNVSQGEYSESDAIHGQV